MVWSGIAECAVQAAFAPTATAAQVLGGQLFDRDDVMAGRQAGGGLMDLMGTDRGYPSANPATRALARSHRFDGSRRV